MRLPGLGFRVFLAAALIVGALAIACNGDGSSTGSATPSESASAADTSRTEEALGAQLGYLAAGTLTTDEVPADYQLSVSQPVTRGQVAAANVTIPRLAGFVQNSNLKGAWATFYLREDPQTGLSSLVYEFPAPEAAQAFVDTIAGLSTADYPEAASVERVPSDKIEDAAQMMLYRLTGSRTYEYTWAQGRFAGQVVLRYAGDIDSPDDRSLIVALARKQAEHMRSIGP